MKTPKQTTSRKTTKSRPVHPGKPTTAQTKPEAAGKPTPESAAKKHPQVLEGKPVMQHDLQGFAMMCLPERMREILGEEAYEECIRQLQEMALTLIVRQPEKVLFVDLAWSIAEPSVDALQLKSVKAGESGSDKSTGKTKSARVRAKPASRKS